MQNHWTTNFEKKKELTINNIYGIILWIQIQANDNFHIIVLNEPPNFIGKMRNVFSSFFIEANERTNWNTQNMRILFGFYAVYISAMWLFCFLCVCIVYVENKWIWFNKPSCTKVIKRYCYNRTLGFLGLHVMRLALSFSSVVNFDGVGELCLESCIQAEMICSLSLPLSLWDDVRTCINRKRLWFTHAPTAPWKQTIFT